VGVDGVFPTELAKKRSFASQEVMEKRSTKPVEQFTSHKSVTVELQSHDLLSNSKSKNSCLAE
jgi:hypothetical protein